MGMEEGWADTLQTLKRYALRPKSQELFLRYGLLICIYLLAFSIRLVSVLQKRSCAS